MTNKDFTSYKFIKWQRVRFYQYGIYHVGTIQARYITHGSRRVYCIYDEENLRSYTVVERQITEAVENERRKTTGYRRQAGARG